MPITVKMPEVAETVVEGTIQRWLKKPGDSIEEYESLVEIVTDKVNVELPSPAAGTLKEILVQEGETVAIGTPLAILEARDEVRGETPAGAPAHPSARPASHTEPPAPSSMEAPRRHYSPLVQRLAQEYGIDLGQVQGTGAGGRITKDDVLARIERMVGVLSTEEKETPPRDVETGLSPGAEINVDPIRRAMAQRLVQSVQTIPHAWTMMEADVSNLVARVAAQKDEFRQREGFNLTYLPFVVQAVISALKELPMVNSSWVNDKIKLHGEINIGIAVAREEGLIVPVLNNAKQLGLAELARGIHDLVEKARQNKLSVQDVQGGTFTVNNTGALGSVLSMPIINPPQAAIITTEAVVKRAVVVNDAIAIRSVMNLCLSFDHRILDGGHATRFLALVKQGLEEISAS